MAAISVLNTIIDNTRNYLDKMLLVDSQPEWTSDGWVITGRLREDPTVAQMNLQVRPGNSDWQHGLNLSGGGSGIGEFVYEVGGEHANSFQRRRFFVDLDLYFEGEADAENARRQAMVTLSRTGHALWTLPVRTWGRDDFGEKVMKVEVNDNYLSESGGEGMFIWRGKMQFTVLTSMEPVDEAP